jgi:hypothetical protein
VNLHCLRLRHLYQRHLHHLRHLRLRVISTSAIFIIVFVFSFGFAYRVLFVCSLFLLLLRGQWTAKRSALLTVQYSFPGHRGCWGIFCEPVINWLGCEPVTHANAYH